MYVIVSKYVDNRDLAKMMFSEMIQHLKDRGAQPLLCENESGFFVARVLYDDDGYIFSRYEFDPDSETSSVVAAVNVIEEL